MREREREREGQREREDPKQAPSLAQSPTWAASHDHEIMTWAKTKSLDA